MENSEVKLSNIELTTEIVPVLDLGMYGSILSPENLFESSMADLASENKKEVDFDFKSYKEGVGKIAGKIIKEELGDLLGKYGVKDIVFVGISSPQFYNYSSDKGMFDLIVDDTFDEKVRAQIDEWRKEDGWEDETNRLIKNVWGSRSGFISWMPQNVQEIYELDDYERCVAAFVTLLMVDMDIISHSYRCGFDNELLQTVFYNECAETLSYHDYATIETIFPEEIYETYIKHPDTLDEIIWELHDAGVLKYSHFPERNRTDGGISFMEWCVSEGYETLEELRELINTKEA